MRWFTDKAILVKVLFSTKTWGEWYLSSKLKAITYLY